VAREQTKRAVTKQGFESGSSSAATVVRIPSRPVFSLRIGLIYTLLEEWGLNRTIRVVDKEDASGFNV